MNQVASIAPVWSRDDGAHDGDPLARRPVGADALDDAAHRRLLPELQVAHVLAVAEVLVAAREVVDEVADRRQAERGQLAGGGLAHAGQAGERPLEGDGVDGEAGDRRRLLVRGRRRIAAGVAVPVTPRS